MTEKTSFISVGLLAIIFALANTLLFTQSNICTIACTCEHVSQDGISCNRREAICREFNCSIEGCINQNNLQCYLQGNCYSGWCAVGWILIAMSYSIGVCALVMACWQRYKEVSDENEHQHSNYVQLRDNIQRPDGLPEVVKLPEESNKIDLVI